MSFGCLSSMYALIIFVIGLEAGIINKMRVGFTGTQSGMTGFQRTAFINLINNMNFDELHIGDCKGADTEAYSLFYGIKIGHIPDNNQKRSFLKYDEERLPKPYLERNHDIVDETEILIATPKESKEVLRSGTWATIRYAKKQNKKVYVIFPDGNWVD